MSNHAVRRGVACALALSAPTLVSAHTDDPKLRDIQPAVQAPAFRADVDPAPLVEFSARRVRLESWLPLAEFANGGNAASSCFGYVSPAGREYALVCLERGTGVVDVTSPGNAQVVGEVAGPASRWRDVRTYGHYAYAVSEGGGGIQVIDLSRVDEGVVALVNTVLDGGPNRKTHTLAIDVDSGFLYRAGGAGTAGLRIYSLADPANPTFITHWADRYVHEAQIVTYTQGPYADRQIAFCCGGFNGGWNETALHILDVTDKANVFQLSQLAWPDAAYSHQSWLTPDRRYAYVNDELDGIPSNLVIDVQDLTNPWIVRRFVNNESAIDHNLYTVDNRIFQATYRAGLRIFQYQDPTQPYEIAWFDTYPQDDRASFNSLWNVYPYLPSGTIVGSDIEKGLFVWRLRNTGDANCDGEIDLYDIAAFALALTDPAQYLLDYPGCHGSSADLNEDGIVDAFDVEPFVDCLVTRCH